MEYGHGFATDTNGIRSRICKGAHTPTRHGLMGARTRTRHGSVWEYVRDLGMDL